MFGWEVLQTMTAVCWPEQVGKDLPGSWQLAGKAGSVMLSHTMLWHRRPPNTGQTPRRVRSRVFCSPNRFFKECESWSRCCSVPSCLLLPALPWTKEQRKGAPCNCMASPSCNRHAIAMLCASSHACPDSKSPCARAPTAFRCSGSSTGAQTSLLGTGPSTCSPRPSAGATAL